MPRTLDGQSGSSSESKQGFVQVCAHTANVNARTLPVDEYEYTQLSPGRFEIEATTAFVDEVVVSRTVVEALTAGVVVPNPTYLGFIVPYRWQGQYLFNGAEVTPTSLCISTGRNGYHTRGAGRDIIGVGLSRRRFAATLAALRGVRVDDIRLPDGVVRLPGPAIARLRRRVASILNERASSDTALPAAAAADEVYALFIDACLAAEPGAESESRRGPRRMEIVRKAEECFVRAEGKPISLADLCAAAGVGRTSLEMAFRDLYGESPISYFHKRRLMKAREALVLASPERGAIKRAALDAGRSALGRFSVEYRLLFGERPSATLSAAPISGD